MTPDKTIWTPAMEAKLRSMAFGRSTVPKIAAAVGCSETAVRNKAGKLRLPLTDRIDEPVFVRIMHHTRAGRPGSPGSSAFMSRSSRSTLPF
jgi:hypothetical protein